MSFPSVREMSPVTVPLLVKAAEKPPMWTSPMIWPLFRVLAAFDSIATAPLIVPELVNEPESSQTTP